MAGRVKAEPGQRMGVGDRRLGDHPAGLGGLGGLAIVPGGSRWNAAEPILGSLGGAPLGAAGSHDVGCEGRSEAAPHAPEEPPHLPSGGGEMCGRGGTGGHGATWGPAPGREGQWSPDAGGSRSLTPELNSLDVECAPWKLSHARRCRREWIRASPGGRGWGEPAPGALMRGMLTVHKGVMGMVAHRGGIYEKYGFYT